jgi:hypothetical protein
MHLPHVLLQVVLPHKPIWCSLVAMRDCAAVWLNRRVYLPMTLKFIGSLESFLAFIYATVELAS